MRLALVTDAWLPQVNGVVRTLSTLTDRLRGRGEQVLVVEPGGFWTIPTPTYPEIRLAVAAGGRVRNLITAFAPDAVHIATEGPLGLAARRFCMDRKLPFTTSLHTRFPEYVHARFRLPVRWGYAFLRWFHRPSRAIMVATPAIEAELREYGFQTPIKRWTRGVDTEQFRPDLAPALDMPRPVFLYVGRVAVEKNLEAFLSLDLPGTKLVVGDGPQREELERKYPAVRFAGARFGADLARHYACGDVFVFPSRTDTFGLVLLEAMATGLPVAALPVPGPIDVVGPDGPGVLDEDLRAAALKALNIPREAARAWAERFSWDASVDQFVSNLHPFDSAGAFPLASA